MSPKDRTIHAIVVPVALLGGAVFATRFADHGDGGDLYSAILFLGVFLWELAEPWGVKR